MVKFGFVFHSDLPFDIGYRVSGSFQPSHNDERL